MTTGDDNFDAYQQGGEWVDLDLLHVEVDSGVIDSITNLAAGTVSVTLGWHED